MFKGIPWNERCNRRPVKRLLFRSAMITPTLAKLVRCNDEPAQTKGWILVSKKVQVSTSSAKNRISSNSLFSHSP